MSRTLWSVIVLSLAICSLAFAGPTTWNFSSPTGNLGTSHSYTVGGIMITTYGFFSTTSGSTLTLGKTDNLNGKHDGGSGSTSENGLGLFDESTKEIDKLHAVELDFSNPIFNGTLVTVTLGSIQTNPQESYSVFDRTSLGGNGSTFALLGSSGRTSGSFTFTGGGSNSFIAISGKVNDVLISTASISNVPEPRFYGLLLAGMLAVFGILIRSRRASERA
jgi:hypothetical protein